MNYFIFFFSFDRLSIESIILFIYLFIYLFLAVLGLCCFTGFSLVGESGAYSRAAHGLLIAVAFLAA